MQARKVVIHIGLLDIHRHEYEYRNVTLSNTESVLGLIALRSKLDKYYDYGIKDNPFSASNWKDVNQELIALYADLDGLIDRAGLDESELTIVHALELGYSFVDLADMLGVDVRVVMTKCRGVARKIARRNNREWAMWANFNYVKTDWKQCRICGDWLPLNERYYYRKENMIDGFYNECKECVNLITNINK